ncbi:hypothetical protein [uncultured Corynebacterium sp.]|uniref:hypothetical protein n=1 Tax=uncultured Corynebacterium sp. TaxID=159447 RepID=UPI0025D79ABA|nr:hypothetical protein [uncultured Corynebacterium sp.]
MQPTTIIKCAPGLMEIALAWKPLDWSIPLDHYRVEGRRRGHGWQLLKKTIFPFYRHDRLLPQGEEWHYRVKTVDAAGNVSRPSRPIRAKSLRSVVTGKPLATAGHFDRQSTELKFAPRDYKKIPVAFPDGKISVTGNNPEIPYLLPGPKDAWAGEKSYSLTWEFDLAKSSIEPHRSKIHLALWFIDTTKLGGSLEVELGGFRQTLSVPKGATAGSKKGDARRDDGSLKPGCWEKAIPSDSLREGRNTLTLTMRSGGWIAWDAIGLFAADFETADSPPIHILNSRFGGKL